MKDFSRHFRHLAERALPERARLVMPGGGSDLIIFTTWPLSGDPHRPSKRSRTVRVLITQEALEDYARGSDGHRLASDERFTAWMREQLSRHKANHDAPPGVEPPPVTWTLGTLDLNR